jgi:histone-lysine N-methyltransferase SETD7
MGQYVNGKPEGYFWAGMVGGGFFHGKMAEDGTITGSDMTFIYPDMETVLLGKYNDRIMIDAKESSVLEESCDYQSGLRIVTK